MKKSLFVFLMFAALLAGCAGRRADPVSAYSPGDENKSCESLRQEIVDIQNRMLALLPKTDKSIANTLWSVGGTVASYTPAGTAASVVPYFFIDMKDAERIEYNALCRRHNRLLLVAQSKSCDMAGIRAEPIPTLNEKDAAEKEAKKAEEHK